MSRSHSLQRVVRSYVTNEEKSLTICLDLNNTGVGLVSGSMLQWKMINRTARPQDIVLASSWKARRSIWQNQRLEGAPEDGRCRCFQESIS